MHRRVERGGRAEAICRSEAAVSRDGLHPRARQVNGANAVASHLGNVQRGESRTEGGSRWIGKRRGRPDAVRAPDCPVPCKDNYSRGRYVDETDTVIVRIRNKEDIAEMPRSAERVKEARVRPAV